jgi:hypothetical protein
MDTTALLLTIAFRHRINEPNIEMGFENFVVLIGETRHGPARPGHPAPRDGDPDNPLRPDHDDAADVTFDAFRDAVGACLRDGLIREPIRLPEGALQCHWHLELTPAGVATARSMPGVMGG